MTSPSQPNTPSGDPAPVQDRPPTSTRAGGPRSVLGIILLVLAWAPTILLVLIILAGWALVLTGDLAVSGAVVVTIICGGTAGSWYALLTWIARWVGQNTVQVPAVQPPAGPALTAAPGAGKPIWKRWWAITLVSLLVIIMISLANAISKDRTTGSTTAPAPTAETTTEAAADTDAEAEASTPVPETTTEATMETPTEQTPAVEAITDEQARAELQAFIDGRAAAGVAIAKTVTDLTVTDGVVTATFDPAAAGMDQATFDAVNAFPNLAKFVGAPMESDDEQGNRLRTRVTRVDTVSADGKSLGSMTAAELYRVGTGKDLPSS